MNIGSILYTILIGPLKLLFEVIYTLAYFISGSAGLSIIVLSLTMNILLLPLYNMADRIQAEENRTQEKLKKGVDHIKKAFKGDEQYMVLNTYYRQNGYKPIYALRNSISLLLEIPFFIAAYDFLSNEYSVLSASFGPIASLGAPDHLLSGLNLLPILMTVINIVSSMIYTKGQPFRQNIQLYVMALAFLVFLYNRPAGLVFYWTLNNVFSLVKNIFVRLKNASLILAVAMSLCGIAGLIAFFRIQGSLSVTIRIAMLILLLLLQLPIIYQFLLKDRIKLKEVQKADDSLFYVETIFLIVLFGLYIPCEVVGSSPSEFLDYFALVNPLRYLFNSFFLVLGSFGVWVMVYYKLMDDRVKKAFEIVLLLACGIAAMDYMLFGRNMGSMSNMLVYDEGINFTMKEALINIASIAGLAIILMVAYIHRKKFILSFMAVMILSMTIFSAVNLFDISKEVDEALESIRKSQTDIAEIDLSTKGKNVVIIILDRAISYYFPYILNEKPELQQTYAGFTYYPNTISYGRSTNLGIPSVYGGYEYTPEEMNKRSDELLMEKHNEALQVMPTLFAQNGYNITLLDPCYANYEYPPDLSLFDGTGYKVWNTEEGMFERDMTLVKNRLEVLNRNFFCFGITKAAPLLLQGILYNGGAYNSLSEYQDMYSEDAKSIMTFQKYIEANYLDRINVLKAMPEMSKVHDDDSDNLMILYNAAPHSPLLLQEPDYEIQLNVDNYEYEAEKNFSRTDIYGNVMVLEDYKQMSHYHANISSMMVIGDWLNYLREQGIYDNTRIIIVADHGMDLHQTDILTHKLKNGETEDLMKYNPLLLYKDFGSSELKIDDRFMANADTPVLAMKDLIDDPVNPFTGNRITDERKYSADQHVCISLDNMIRKSRKTYTPGGGWLSVHDNIFDPDNWYEGDIFD